MTGNSSVTREQFSPAQFGLPGPASQFTLYNTSVPVSFTPDLFGGKSRGIEADLAGADYQRFQLEATYLTLTSNVVTAAINDASYAAQIRVTQEQIDGQRELVSLLEQRFGLGAVSDADVQLQKAQLAQTLATLPPLQKARAQGRNQLMAYLGRLPSQDKGVSVRLDALQLPRDLPVTVPSLLVRQRPDIRAAESQVHQASANVGVATANMLPNLDIVCVRRQPGAGALGAVRPAERAAWSVAASIAGPIFDAGSLFHTKESKVAALEQASAQYRYTVITAFQNVADSLRAIQFDAALLKAQVDAENAAAESLKLSQAQFKAGSGTLLNVINAEQTLLTAQINRVRAKPALCGHGCAVPSLAAVGGIGWLKRPRPKPSRRGSPGFRAGRSCRRRRTSPLTDAAFGGRGENHVEANGDHARDRWRGVRRPCLVNFRAGLIRSAGSARRSAADGVDHGGDNRSNGSRQLDRGWYLRGVNGADPRACNPLAGIVDKIHFESGKDVEGRRGAARPAQAKTTSPRSPLQATADGFAIALKRDQGQLKINAVSQATVDSDLINLRNALALVAQQQVLVEQKTLKAPFRRTAPGIRQR